MPLLTLKEDGSLRCTSCMLCVTACPSDSIHIYAGEKLNSHDEKVPVTRNVQGRSLGLPNRIIKYFYEDTGARSKGTTSQTKVYRKKSKLNNPTTEV